jgi:hypothetical protein
MEAQQGAIRVFSGTPFPPQRPATHHSDFMRCAIPRTVPSREPLRERSWLFSAAQASQDRASGVRGGRLRCACGRTSVPGWGRGWRDRCLPKNADGPLPRFRPSAVPDASTHAWSNPRPPPCPDTLPLHRGSPRPWRARPQFAAKSAVSLLSSFRLRAAPADGRVVADRLRRAVRCTLVRLVRSFRRRDAGRAGPSPSCLIRKKNDGLTRSQRSQRSFLVPFPLLSW